MTLFKRNKFKLSLIEDYIKILMIKNFVNNYHPISNLKTINILKTTRILTHVLETSYNNAFQQLKMDDLSLLILKKELKNNNSLFLQNKNLELTIKSNFLQAVEIYRQAPHKFNQLKLKPSQFLDLLL